MDASYKIPSYPTLGWADVHPKQQRVISDITLPADWKQNMEWDLDVVADQVGGFKQCNPLLVITSQKVGFTESLRAAWLGGKKNDVILVIGISQWPTIEWAQVLAWSKDTALEPTLRYSLEGSNASDRNLLVSTFATAILQHYSRDRMTNYSYLKSEIQAPWWLHLVGLCYVITAAGIVLLCYQSTYSSSRYHSAFRRF